MLIPYHQKKQQKLYNWSSHVAMTWPPLGKLRSPFGNKIMFNLNFKAPPYFSHFISTLFMTCALPPPHSVMFPFAAINLVTFQTLCAHYISDLEWYSVFLSSFSSFFKINVSISLLMLTHSWSLHWLVPTNCNMKIIYLIEENIWIIK